MNRNAQHRKQHREQRNGRKQRANGAPNALMISGAHQLGNENLTARGVADGKTAEQPGDLSAQRHCGEACAAHKLPHYHHIHQVIHRLEGVGQHKRERKPQQLFSNAASGQIVDHCFLQCDILLCN